MKPDPAWKNPPPMGAGRGKASAQNPGRIAGPVFGPGFRGVPILSGFPGFPVSEMLSRKRKTARKPAWLSHFPGFPVFPV